MDRFYLTAKFLGTLASWNRWKSALGVALCSTLLVTGCGSSDVANGEGAHVASASQAII